MSEAQRQKGVKARQRVCTKPKHESKGYARLQVKSMKRSGLAGMTSRITVYACPICSTKKKPVFHVGHRGREIV